MSICKSVQLMLCLLPALAVGFFWYSTPIVEETCTRITCPSFKTNETTCSLLGYVGDPLTNECIPKCKSQCYSGVCSFCYCLLPSTTLSSNDLYKCTNIYNRYEYDKKLYVRQGNYCPDEYVISPYDTSECIRRCNSYSCNMGYCSPQGTCVCHLGYRPDPLNPRTCTKIPTNPPNPQPSNGRESYEPNTRDDSNLICTNKCKDETCTPSIICKCPDGYEFNGNISGCEIKANMTVDDDLNSNETTIIWNMTFMDTKMMPAENMSSNLYTPISAFIIAILLVTIFVLVFIIIKQKQTIRKQTNPQEQNEEEYSPNYYSIAKFEKKSNDGILVENIELYGETTEIPTTGGAKTKKATK